MDVTIRITKTARDRLRKRAFREEKSMKDLIEELSKPKRGVPIRGTVN